MNEDEVPVLQLRCIEDVKMGLLRFVKVYLHDVELSARGIFTIMHLRRKKKGWFVVFAGHPEEEREGELERHKEHLEEGWYYVVVILGGSRFGTGVGDHSGQPDQLGQREVMFG